MAVVKLFFVLLLSLALARAHPFDEDEDEVMHNYHDDFEPTTRFNLAQEQTAEFWIQNARDQVRKNLEELLNFNKVKNVIYFLGDGMSIPTLAAARAYKGQLEGRPGEESQLAFEKFPVVGLSKTYCIDRQTADSACSATAFLSGIKANYNTIGVTGSVPRSNCERSKDPATHVDSILKKAIDKGLNAGIVTTTRITHATPAGAYAHVAHRSWESDSHVTSLGHNITECPDIAHQLIHNNPGKDFKVILGGGRREFLPNTTLDEERYRGHRTDGRNLINEWINNKAQAGQSHEYVWNREQLLSVSDDTDYLLGLFEGSHCLYHMEGNRSMEPSFTDMVEKAINMLSNDDEGFFLFAEGGRIDHAHHSTRGWNALDETVEFSKAIERALEMTSREDTLIVVTSDHSHVMTLSGYPSRGNPILGASDRHRGSDGIPYTTISYANGPGYRPDVNGNRVDVTRENMTSPSFRYPTMVPLSSETHGADDVAVFAIGPWQQIFTGVYEQSAIPHMISYAACLDDEFSSCNGKHFYGL